MLESLRIENFRKYKDYKIDSFDCVNIILGENNIGKTSILEAVYAWACGQNVAPFLNIPLARGRYGNLRNPYWLMDELLATVNDRYSLPFKLSFEGKNDGRDVRFEHIISPSDFLTVFDSAYKNDPYLRAMRVTDTEQNDSSVYMTPMMETINPTRIAKWEVKHEEETVEVEFTTPQIQIKEMKPYRLAKWIDVFSHISIQENVQIYAALKREKLLQTVVDRMRQVFPEISGFDMIPYPDGSQSPVCVEKKDGTTLPMFAYGDGVQKWFYVLGMLTFYKNSIICIDELDSGLHPGAQVSFALNMIDNALDNNVQLFTTTHNIEFVDNLLKSVSDHPQKNRIRVITLKDCNGELKQRSLSAEEAYKAREDYNLELR